MEKEINIVAPEGYEIDKEKSSFEKIVFKKKWSKPRSWEDYCENYTRDEKYFINTDSSIIGAGDGIMLPFLDRNTLPTKEMAEKFLAYMQLMSLRQAWIGDWEPDWSNEYLYKYCIIGMRCNFEVCPLSKCRYALSFPTKEMAEEFMDCFRDLLEQAKGLC